MSIMRTPILACLSGLLLLCSCQKSDPVTPPSTTVPTANNPVTVPGFTQYSIPRGTHYSNNNSYREVELSEMKFLVKFDSTAIYTTQDPSNQFDINKLYGFSDNGAGHHEFSARYGWRWSTGALRLFAYVYNQGGVISKELTTVAIGAEVSCSIQVTASSYLFTTNGITERLPRMATTPKGKGYQLYPYFGGDEKAPHQVNIWIRNL